MKKILVLMFTVWVALCVQSPQSEIDAVEDSVVDAHVWLEGAWDGKVSGSESHIIDKETKISIKAEEDIPAGKVAIIQKHFNRPDYRNKRDREAEREEREEREAERGGE